MKRVSLVFVGVAVMLVAVAASSVKIRAQRETSATPTFNQDVAPILFNNCVTCHSPGQVAPMSLLSYKEARPWARAIKAKVATREMPPWHADPRFGVFRNTRSLTQAQIDTLVAWADHGAPEGTGVPPAPPSLPEGGWSHPSGRPPDLVVEMPYEHEVPAQGQIPWYDSVQPWPFKEDQFVEAVQVLPGNVPVTHHLGAHWRILRPGTKIGPGPGWPGGPILPNVQVNDDGTPIGRRTDRAVAAPADAESSQGGAQDEQGSLVIYVPPRGINLFRPGVGKRIPGNSVLHWTHHYTMTGQPEKDRSRIGLWFHKVPMEVETITSGSGGLASYIAQGQEVAETTLKDPTSVCAGPCLPVIPPNEGNWAVTGVTALQDDVTIHLMWPHMHLRGKDMTYVVTYPDGREEVLLSVPRYNFNWQLFYELAEPAHIPAGSTLRVLAHYDNSVRNRENPGPDKEVYWSEQSWDEMFTGFHELSIDKKDRRLVKGPATASNR